jgi:hypothetical protein
MVKLGDVLAAEIIKTKRTWNFPLVLLFPVIVTIIVFVYYTKNLLGYETTGNNYTWIIYSQTFFQFYFIIYPLLAALIAFSLSNIEHRNNGLKQIFTFPTFKFFFISVRYLSCYSGCLLPSCLLIYYWY